MLANLQIFFPHIVDVDPDPQTTWLFVLFKEYMPAVEQELFELISAGRQVLICHWFLHQPKVSSILFYNLAYLHCPKNSRVTGKFCTVPKSPSMQTLPIG